VDAIRLEKDQCALHESSVSLEGVAQQHDEEGGK
jgi:hypothetical protein